MEKENKNSVIKNVKENIIDIYYQKKTFKRRAYLQKLDNELFNEYYKIYERIRMSQYGVNRLFPNERYCVATDAFYEFSDNLVEKFTKKQASKSNANKFLKNGMGFATIAAALTTAQVTGILPTNIATVATTVAIAGCAIMQNFENRYAKKHHLAIPSKTDFVYDKVLTPEFKFVKDRYENMAAIDFATKIPKLLGIVGF